MRHAHAQSLAHHAIYASYTFQTGPKPHTHTHIHTHATWQNKISQQNHITQLGLAKIKSRTITSRNKMIKN